jgi:hypothetical protein
MTRELLSNIAYDLLKLFVGFVLSTAPVIFIIRKMSIFLGTWKNTIAVWASVSLALALGVLVATGATQPPRANFQTEMTVGYGGFETHTNENGREIPNEDKAAKVMIFTTLVNSGAGPSIALGFLLAS